MTIERTAPGITLPAIPVEPIGRHATVEALLRHTLARSVSEIVRLDAPVRLGTDAEDVHQFRVAARRLRSDLRTFAPLLDANWSGTIRDELAWLGNEVGAQRDADVLATRLAAHLAGLPDRDTADAEPLLAQLAGTTRQGRDRLIVALCSERYVSLAERLVEATEHPRLADGLQASARRPARSVTADLVAKPWRRLKREADAVDSNATDGELHRIRILAKRARYAVEAVIPLYGRDAGKFARSLARLQAVLGDHHDTTVAEEWLRESATDLPATRVVVGMLIASERAERDRLRRRFRTVWKAVSRDKPQSWLR